MKYTCQYLHLNMRRCQDEMALEGVTDVQFNLFTSLCLADLTLKSATSLKGQKDQTERRGCV